MAPKTKKSQRSLGSAVLFFTLALLLPRSSLSLRSPHQNRQPPQTNGRPTGRQWKQQQQHQQQQVPRGWNGRTTHHDPAVHDATKRLRKFETEVSNLFQWTMVLLSYFHVTTCLRYSSQKIPGSTLCMLILSLCNLSFGMFCYWTQPRPSKAILEELQIQQSSQPASSASSLLLSIRSWFRRWKLLEWIHWFLTGYMVWSHFRKDWYLFLLGIASTTGIWIRHELQIPRTLQFAPRHPLTLVKIVYMACEFLVYIPPGSLLLIALVTALQLHHDARRWGWVIGIGIPTVANLLASIGLSVDLEDVHHVPHLSFMVLVKHRVTRWTRVLTCWWALSLVAFVSLVVAGVQIQFSNQLYWSGGNTLVYRPLQPDNPLLTLGILWIGLPYFLQYLVHTFITEEGYVSLTQQPSQRRGANTADMVTPPSSPSLR